MRDLVEGIVAQFEPEELRPVGCYASHRPRAARAPGGIPQIVWQPGMDIAHLAAQIALQLD